MARDLLLDTLTHDLKAEGNLEWVNGHDAVVQRLRIRLLTFATEYFLDIETGIPYFDVVLVKAPDLEEIRNVFRAQINDVPGVVQVVSMSTDYDPAARTLGLEFTVVLSPEERDDTRTSNIRATIGLDDGSSLLLLDYHSAILT